MKWPTLASICFWLALPALAFAQDANHRSAGQGQAGHKHQRGDFRDVCKRDCTAGPLPAVRLVTPPTHGQVTVKQGQLRATN